jgi:hypothetical protein
MDSGESASTLTHTLTWHQEPGIEINDCHVFKLDNADTAEIDRITVKFPPGSHHVHIYRSDSPDATDHVDACWNGIDWLRWHLVLGVQSEQMDWQLPQGLTIPFDAHQQLLVQVHWINTTPDPIDRNIKLQFHTAESSQAHVGTVFGVNKQTAMVPHQHKVLTQWCPVPQGGKILALMGHYHGLGVKYAVDSRKEGAETGTPIYDALDEQTFQFKTFTPGFAVPADEGLQFECDYYNSRDIDIGWGADTRRMEHCNMSAYYYPAKAGELSLFCTQEAVEVDAIIAPDKRIAPGTTQTFTLHLNQAAAVAASAKLVSSDPSALQVPASVAVEPGATSVTFEAKALRTAKVTISATLGTQTHTEALQIGGLVLSEVFVGAPNETDQRQWVEISNLTDEPIDLANYSLGAGTADYTATRVQLNFTLPARGCAVVGGPLLAPSQPDYEQVAPFQPNLRVDGTAGVALFEAPADQISAGMLPYDTLVYGASAANASLRAPTGEMAQVVSTAPANGSYVRMAEAQWAAQTTPTPRICEVH